jgi:hypothetical protein
MGSISGNRGPASFLGLTDGSMVDDTMIMGDMARLLKWLHKWQFKFGIRYT